MWTSFARSALSGDRPMRDACRSIGRKLMYSPSAFRSPSKPLSGRFARGTASHLGPPTAPSRMASAALQAASVSAGSGSPVCVNGASAERELGEVEFVAEFRGTPFQHAHGGAHDFRADAVARQENNFLSIGHGFIADRRQTLFA